MKRFVVREVETLKTTAAWYDCNCCCVGGGCCGVDCDPGGINPIDQ